MNQVNAWNYDHHVLCWQAHFIAKKIESDFNSYIKKNGGFNHAMRILG